MRAHNRIIQRSLLSSQRFQPTGEGLELFLTQSVPPELGVAAGASPAASAAF